MAQAQEVFLFSPANVATCVMWFDAAEASTVIRSGTNVTQWNDKTGNGNTATAGTATYPVYKPTSLNNLATIGLQGTNDYFLVNNNLTTTTYPSLCYFIVMNPASSQPNTTYAGVLSTDTATAYGRTLGLGSGTWQIEYYNNFNNVTAYTANQWYITSLQFVGTTSTTLAVNGTTYAGSASSTGNNTTGFKIGSYNSDGSYATYNSSFDVGEILVYGASLTTDQRQQVEGYLAWKWGLVANLPSTHPYKSVAPLGNAPFPITTNIPMPINNQGRSVFIPTQISGCSFWLDAADPTVVTSNASSVVTGVRDKSGNGYNLTNTLTTSGFTWNQTLFNTSYPSFYYNSTQNVTLGSNSSFSISQPATVFSVHQVVGSATNQDVFDATDSTNRFFGFYFGGNTNYRIYAGVTLTQTGTMNPNGGVYSHYFNSTSSAIYENGTLIASGDAGTLNCTGITIGSRFTQTTETWQGHICEVIYYSGILTTAQRQQVEGYLSWKWGLQGLLSTAQPFKSNAIAPFPFRIIPFYGSLNSWTPRQLSGLSIWLDASDPATLVFTGANVTTWNDKSGNGYNATGSGSTTITTIGKNNAITLDGSTTYFLYSGSTINSTNFLSAFVVATFGDMGANPWRRLLSFGDPDYNATTNAVAFNRNSTNNSVQYERVGYPTPTITLTPPTNFVGSTLFTTTGITQFINGSSNASTSGSYSAFGYSLYNVGRYSGGGYNWTGAIGEVIAYNAALTTQQRQTVEGYLAWKWGLQGSLPANHPFKLFPPSP